MKDCEIQDGDIQQQETVDFMDLQPHDMVNIMHSPEELSDNMAMDSVSLADFLSRPVNIYTGSWVEADAIGVKAQINPWHLFFNKPTIKYKLNNWAFVKCNLKLRIVYNASPFYYGSMMACWQPLQGISPSYLISDGGLKQMIPYSQMPGRAMIEPQQPKDVEITLPFFWPGNFLRAELASDFTNMGQLSFNIINVLKSANEVVGAGLTFQVYAWATDVVLSGPSEGLAMQDGTYDDEYSDEGAISKPASAIANIAARLGDVPVIGKFATATQIGATAVSHIAKLFGFTNVPVIEDQKPAVVRALPPIATTDIGFPFEKLTVDAKNELTIDHRSVGLGSQDELPISSIVQRESFLTSFDWSTASAASTVLFTSAVTPMLFDVSADVNPVTYMTPPCWLGSMFDYWRGDVIFRFRIICSKYHRGRLMINFDPDGNAGLNLSTNQDPHLVMTKIVDISETTDVEMRIPYQQYQAWLTTKNAYEFRVANKYWGTANLFRHVRGATNGSISLSIHTLLTAPVDPSTVSIQVYVRGAENMDFASPTTQSFETLSAAALQDGMLIDGTTEKSDTNDLVAVTSGAISRPVDHLYLTYMGERVASLRVLLRRQCMTYTHAPPAQAVTDYVVKRLSLPRMPLPFGYDANALDTAKGIIDVAGNYRFNWTHATFLAYISPAFRGNRGSVNWTCVLDNAGDNPLRWFTVIRDKIITTPTQGWVNAAMGTTSANAKFWRFSTNSTTAGALVATGQTANGANWQMPFYSQYKFNFNDSATLNGSNSSEFVTKDYWTSTWSHSGSYGPSANALKLHYYSGAGTDFDLLYFLHVPTYTIPTSTPVAV